jgi:hypothetical protein
MFKAMEVSDEDVIEEQKQYGSWFIWLLYLIKGLYSNG